LCTFYSFVALQVYTTKQLVVDFSMSGCAAFSRILWTCAKYSYTQPLKSVPTYRRWLCNFRIKSLCAVVNLSNRAVNDRGTYVNSVRALMNHHGQSLRYFSDKADDKTDAVKESSPGLLRRFHQTYKEHGKILVCVHLVTSAVWAGLFYWAAVRYMTQELFSDSYHVAVLGSQFAHCGGTWSNSAFHRSGVYK